MTSPPDPMSPANARPRVRLLAPCLAALLGLVPAAARAEEPIKRGGARLYVNAKRIEIDGKFCLAEGPIELLACGRGGKEYESIIVLNVNPKILHLLMVFMGLKPGTAGSGPRFQGDPDHAPSGSPAIVRVTWTGKDGKKVTVRAEDLCWNAIDKRPMRRTPWVFVGSKIEIDPETKKKVYWANKEKSIITVFRDPYAVMDLPLALGANDDAYVVNKQIVPKVGTPCTVILTPGPKTAPPPKNAAGGAIVHLDITRGARTLIGGIEPETLGDALKKLAREAPKDTYRVTMDHGAPPKAAADAFEAIRAAGLRIETFEMESPKPDVADAVTVRAAAGKLFVNGTERSPEAATRQIRDTLGKKKNAGVALTVDKGAGLADVVRALRACEDIDGVVLRIVWPGAALPGKAAALGKVTDIVLALRAAPDDGVTVSVSAKGPGGRELLAADDRARWEQTIRRLGQNEGTREKVAVIIESAPAVAYKHVIAALNACRGARFKQVSFVLSKR